MHVGSLAPSTSHPPLLVCGGSFAPPSALRPHLCTPPLLCGISFAPPLCFAPSTLHPPSILRPLLCGDKRISKTKESKRIFSCKNRRRYSRKRATICRHFANRRSLTRTRSDGAKASSGAASSSRGGARPRRRPAPRLYPGLADVRRGGDIRRGVNLTGFLKFCRTWRTLRTFSDRLHCVMLHAPEFLGSWVGR